MNGPWSSNGGTATFSSTVLTTADLTLGSTAVANLGTTTGLVTGMVVQSSNVTPGTTITVSGSTVTLSQAALGNATGAFIAFYPVVDLTTTWTVPNDVHRIFLTMCGGGCGGAGGWTAAGGGGGGGGGASCTVHDMPVFVEPGEVINVKVGHGGAGGAKGAAGSAGTGSQIYSGLVDSVPVILSSGQYMPTARGQTISAYLARPGTATDGGTGGYGAPLYGGQTAVAGGGGNAGGAAGTGATQAGDGLIAIYRGKYITTGGSGGGGGSSASLPGIGGTDTPHFDGSAIEVDLGGGGGGGSSALGKGGCKGDSAQFNVGGVATGYGAGGGGGLSNYAGGYGSPGIVIIKW